jgi:hypothetical protein
MKNVTLAIDETLLAKARELAERRQTSLNAMIRGLLVAELDQQDRIEWAREGLRQLMERSTLEFEPGTNLKELSRRDDSSLFHGHERPAARSGSSAGRSAKARHRA